MKRKILFFTTGMTAGGAERVIATLAGALRLQGHEVAIAMLKGEESEYPLAEGITLRSAELEPGLRNLPRAISFYRQAVAQERPDVVISFSTKSDLIALISRILYKTPGGLIVSDRADPYTRNKKMQIACDLLYGRSDVLVCQGKNVATYYRQKIKRAQIRIIPNPLNEDSVGSVSVNPREPLMLSVGRLSEQKNHQLALSVFATVRKKYPNLKMKIYGAGPLHESLEKFIHENNLGEAATLEGIAQNVLRAHENASIFLFTSSHEGYPNALLEAAATGIPVVTTDFSPGTATEIVTEDVNGYIVPVADEEALVQACERVLAGSLDIEKILSASSQVREAHRIDRILEEWMFAIEDAVRTEKAVH